MPQHVRRDDGRIDAGCKRAFLQQLEDAHAREPLAETRDEKMPLGEIAAQIVVAAGKDDRLLALRERVGNGKDRIEVLCAVAVFGHIAVEDQKVDPAERLRGADRFFGAAMRIAHEIRSCAGFRDGIK